MHLIAERSIDEGTVSLVIDTKKLHLVDCDLLLLIIFFKLN